MAALLITQHRSCSQLGNQFVKGGGNIGFMQSVLCSRNIKYGHGASIKRKVNHSSIGSCLFMSKPHAAMSCGVKVRTLSEA